MGPGDRRVSYYRVPLRRTVWHRAEGSFAGSVGRREICHRERGSALILALMVAIILAFLGLGLLLQSSLGLQAAGTDRWVTKSMYAADSGIKIGVELLALGQVRVPEQFELEDDPDQEGWLKGRYQVLLEQPCEIEEPAPVPPSPDGMLVFEYPKFTQRSFHLRSRAERPVTSGVVSSAQVETDVTVWPVEQRQLAGSRVRMCF